MKDEPTDPISFVRKIVSDAMWGIDYHGEQLAIARKNLRFCEELIRRGDFDTEATRTDADDEDNEDFENVTQFALSLFDDCQSSVKWHEKNLVNAHNGFAMARIMLERGNYTEIDLDQVRAEHERRRAEGR